MILRPWCAPIGAGICLHSLLTLLFGCFKWSQDPTPVVQTSYVWHRIKRKGREARGERFEVPKKVLRGYFCIWISVRPEGFKHLNLLLGWKIILGLVILPNLTYIVEPCLSLDGRKNLSLNFKACIFTNPIIKFSRLASSEKEGVLDEPDIAFWSLCLHQT